MAVKLDFTRQSTLIPQEVSGLTTTIVGVGSIGSHVAEVLAKTGIGILHVWDADTVESHNLANQGYYLNDLGKKKVDALKERLELGTGVTVVPHDQFYEGGPFGTELVVSALDSMAARQLVFTNFLNDPAAKIYLDGRMGSRFGKVFFVDKDDKDSVANYLGSLHSDAEAHTEPCTARSTIFCAYGIASLMCSALVSWIISEKYPHQVGVDFRNFTVLPQAR